MIAVGPKFFSSCCYSMKINTSVATNSAHIDPIQLITKFGSSYATHCYLIKSEAYARLKESLARIWSSFQWEMKPTTAASVLVSSLLIFVCGSELPPLVTTRIGQIRGWQLKSSQGRPFLAFRGIPYAKPPTGDLRFRVSFATADENYIFVVC